MTEIYEKHANDLIKSNREKLYIMSSFNRIRSELEKIIIGDKFNAKQQ